MIRLAAAADIEALAALRHALWPDEPMDVRRAEAAERVARTDPRIETFVAEVDGEVAGFAEVSLRSDYVNGCDTSPVTFLEGIYVRERHRRCRCGGTVGPRARLPRARFRRPARQWRQPRLPRRHGLRGDRPRGLFPQGAVSAHSNQ